MQYSVLMSVYQKENPEYFRKAIQSMLDQTVKTDDFVIVCDGTLTPDLDQVLEEVTSSFPELFHIIRLPLNLGLGQALNQAIPVCRHSLIARMDSDDLAVPERIEWQLLAFQRNPDLSLCSGQIAEFMEDPEKVVSIRSVPLTHHEIVQYAKKRNPMNHMAVMFRKEAVLDAGSYQPMEMAEDYYLWVRMLVKGYQTENLDQILVLARVGNGMYCRRGGRSYARQMKRLMVECYRLGFLTKIQLCENIAVRTAVSLVPERIRQVFYLKGLRKMIPGIKAKGETEDE